MLIVAGQFDSDNEQSAANAVPPRRCRHGAGLFQAARAVPLLSCRAFRREIQTTRRQLAPSAGLPRSSRVVRRTPVLPAWRWPRAVAAA